MKRTIDISDSLVYTQCRYLLIVCFQRYLLLSHWVCPSLLSLNIPGMLLSITFFVLFECD